MKRALRSDGGWLNSLLRDESGVSAIEFAIVAPFMLLMTLGGIELCIDMSMDAAVQLAAQRAARFGLTVVSPTSGVSRDAEAKAIVMDTLGAWASLPGVSVTFATTGYASYADVGGTTGASTTGSYGTVVNYTVTLTTTGVTGIPKMIGIPTMTFQRNFLVQNEP